MKTWTLGLTDNHDKSALLPLVRMDNACWAQFYGVDKGENVKLAAAAPALQKHLETLLLRWNDYLHLIDQDDDPAYKAQAIEYGNQARALLQTLKG